MVFFPRRLQVSPQGRQLKAVLSGLVARTLPFRVEPRLNQGFDRISLKFIRFGKEIEHQPQPWDFVHKGTTRVNVPPDKRDVLLSGRACGCRWKIAKGDTLGRFREDLGQRRLRECLFHRCKGVVEPLVQWAEPYSVGGQSEWTFTDSLNRLHGIHDRQNRESVGLYRQRDTPSDAALGMHDAGASEFLQDFGEVGRRDFRRLGDLPRGPGFGGLIRQIDDRPQRVFDSLRNQAFSLRRRIRTLTSVLATLCCAVKLDIHILFRSLTSNQEISREED